MTSLSVKVRNAFTRQRHVPARNAWFNLEVDGSWLKVKLVRLGPCLNLNEARERADRKGFRLVEGRALGPFARALPKTAEPDYEEIVVFGGDELETSGGGTRVPCLVSVGGERHPNFCGHFLRSYLWVVTSK